MFLCSYRNTAQPNIFFVCWDTFVLVVIMQLDTDQASAQQTQQKLNKCKVVVRHPGPSSAVKAKLFGVGDAYVCVIPWL